MLVLLIVAMMAAIVAPNIFQSYGARAEDQARRLQQLLSLAANESMLTGVPTRWTAFADGYRFEQPNSEGEWIPMNDHPFVDETFNADARILEVRSQGLENVIEHERDMKRPVLGRLLMMPDGMLTPADIILSIDGAEDRVIQARPGPGGIKLLALQ